jgi:hypothetical protein
MSIEISYNKDGKMSRNVDTTTGYWCEVDYWPTGEWKQYRNSLGFVINWEKK